MLDYNIIGERIKKARKNKKMTQLQLCSILGVSVTYISRVEQGRLPISLKRLNQVCEILEVSEGSILDKK